MKEYMKKLEEVYKDVKYHCPMLTSELSNAEEKLLCRLNIQLVELLTYANGIKGEYDLPIIYSLDEIVNCNINFRTNSAFIDIYNPFDDVLFFLDAGNGDYFGFEIEDNLCKNQVIVWNHENDSRTNIVKDLFTFLIEWGSGHLNI